MDFFREPDNPGGTADQHVYSSPADLKESAGAFCYNRKWRCNFLLFKLRAMQNLKARVREGSLLTGRNMDFKFYTATAVNE